MRLAPRILPALALVAAACGPAAPTTTGSVPPLPPGVAGAVAEKVFNDDGTLVNPRGDTDKDGIPDKDEVDGYTITVDTNGFAVVGGAEAVETRKVTSDPRLADTDGDGLDDAAERMVKSDARRFDTDGDTLTDFDEVRRWKTSPVSIDSDGDARGGDPAHPRPPLFALFDAAELRLQPDPAAPGGPWVPGPGATNPRDPDTDGDGLNDYDELGSGLRKPNVAETPAIQIGITPGTEVSLGWNAKRKNGETYTTSHTSSLDTDSMLTMSTTAEMKLRFFQSAAAGFYQKEKETAGCCNDLATSEIEMGVKLETENRFEATTTMTMSTAASSDVLKTMQDARAEEATQEVELSSGTIRLSVDVVNSGLQPVRVSDATFGVFFPERFRGPMVPLTELAADTSVVLAPGERRTLALSRTDIEVGPMEQLMAHPTSIVLDLARYNLTDAKDVNVDFQSEAIRGRTARVVIDFGEGQLVEKDVLAMTFEDGTVATIGQMLSAMGVEFEAIPTGRQDRPEFDVRIRGKGSEFHEGEAPSLGDTAPYTAHGGTPGSRNLKRGWFATVNRRDKTKNDGHYYSNLFLGPVRPGDVVNIVYSEDLDRDGISAAEELLHGSSDHDTDSDDDGFSDWWEIREGWEVAAAGAPKYRTSGLPGSADADGDGLGDMDEFRLGTDPLLSDTDFDGVGDAREAKGDHGFDPLVPTSVQAPTATCEVTQEAEGDASRPACFVYVPNASPNGGRLLAPCSAFSNRQVVRAEFAGFSFPRCVWLLGHRDGNLTGSNDTASYPALRQSEFLGVPEGLLTAFRDRGALPSSNAVQLYRNDALGVVGCQFDDPQLLVEAEVSGGAMEFSTATVPPRSSYCNVLVQTRSGSFGQTTLGEWAAIPCASFVDPEGDGTCNVIRGAEAITAQINVAPVGPPACDAFNVQPDPYLAVRVHAADGQGDLREVDIQRGTGGAEPQRGGMTYSMADADGFDTVERIDNTCNVDPRTIIVTATDAQGKQAVVPCAFASGQTCHE